MEIDLKSFTPARVALGRTGNSIPTAELLSFQLDHARARDAVYWELDSGWPPVPHVAVESAARSRAEYLRRPDLGRRLSDESKARLTAGDYDAAIVIADGLSALAVQRHAVPVLEELLPLLSAEALHKSATGAARTTKSGRSLIAPRSVLREFPGSATGAARTTKSGGNLIAPRSVLREFLGSDWRLAALMVARQGRVAIGDEIGQTLGARSVVVLIGERPGLSSPDSLGAYVTWDPKPGRTDAERNCVSNIRAEGLGYGAAARLIHLLLSEARRQKLSGVRLRLTENQQIR